MFKQIKKAFDKNARSIHIEFPRIFDRVPFIYVQKGESLELGYGNLVMNVGLPFRSVAKAPVVKSVEPNTPDNFYENSFHYWNTIVQSMK